MYRLMLLALLFPMPVAAEEPAAAAMSRAEMAAAHNESPSDPYIATDPADRITAPARIWRRGGHASIQVNVDGGDNILNDAANEPSIAVDPTNSQRIAIGWRQFDSISSNFRQAGWSFSSDGGASWNASVIDPGVFRSDPVLDADADGNFFYNSLSIDQSVFSCHVYRSSDGGASWDDGTYAFGGDKQWMAIDRTSGIGRGNVYSNWSEFFSCCGDTGFTRSPDGGDSYDNPVALPQAPVWGTTSVAPDGKVYVAGSDGGIVVARSTTLSDPGLTSAFDDSVNVDLGGSPIAGTGPNPQGLLGQVWVAADPSGGEREDWVYLLASVNPPGPDPVDVHFSRSTDGGSTWSPAMRINDDAGTSAWQWFGTMSVAPNGRIDVIWNDTRDDAGFVSVLYYASSDDGGVTWSANQALSQPFDPQLGWPQQNKLGDYYDMVSDNDAAHVAYAATFNGEQDVYYLRIVQNAAIFADDFATGDLTAWPQSSP